jgi:hypothetical protein
VKNSLGFEIQELPDIIRVIVLPNLSEGKTSHKSLLKDQIDKVCMDYIGFEMSDLEKTLDSMASDGRVHNEDGSAAHRAGYQARQGMAEPSPKEGTDPRNRCGARSRA